MDHLNMSPYIIRKWNISPLLNAKETCIFCTPACISPEKWHKASYHFFSLKADNETFLQ